MNKTKAIKEYLENGHIINDKRAAKLFGSYRLGGIICQLRHHYNMKIDDRWMKNETTGDRYKDYFITKEIKNDN